MTGATKGRVAVVALVLVVGAFGVAIAQTNWVRVHWWAWRATSTDPERAALARKKVLEIGWPAIEPVYPAVVAGEVADRVAAVGSQAPMIVFVGFWEGSRESEEGWTVYYTCGPLVYLGEFGTLDGRLEVDGDREPVVPSHGSSTRLLVVARRSSRRDWYDYEAEAVAKFPLHDDEDERRVFAAVRARLEEPH